MTPNMQRLCEAAEVALEDIVNPNDLTRRAQVAKGIVRAVLTALREPSGALETACDHIEVSSGSELIGISYKADEIRAAMIDHILAEPSS